MVDLKTFQNIFRFFLHSALDSTYVHSVDNGQDNEKLIETIATFHTMRTTLCQTIIKHIGNAVFFHNFVGACSCLQYNSVPEKSTCILSGVTLSRDNGVLIVVDKSKLYTFHKRLKVIVLTFWYLLNLPAELTKESINWYREAKRGNTDEKTIANIVDIICDYNNNMFVKKTYVKLMNSVDFVQNQMKEITVINSTKHGSQI